MADYPVEYFGLLVLLVTMKVIIIFCYCYRCASRRGASDKPAERPYTITVDKATSAAAAKRQGFAKRGQTPCDTVALISQADPMDTSSPPLPYAPLTAAERTIPSYAQATHLHP